MLIVTEKKSVFYVILVSYDINCRAAIHHHKTIADQTVDHFLV